MKNRIIIVGPGGSGKDFLTKKFIDRGFRKFIGHTSRPPRVGEIQGQDYFFVHDDYFKNNSDIFYELAIFNNWYYGITKDQWNTADIFIMTPTGIAKISPEDRKSCFIIYLNPRKDIIKFRLSKRHDADSVERRMLEDKKHFRGFKDFDMVVENAYF